MCCSFMFAKQTEYCGGGFLYCILMFTKRTEFCDGGSSGGCGSDGSGSECYALYFYVYKID